ncbi:MAG: hypothetical protein M3Z22_03300 [Verrucomicrobiota bacterium]|nr:hypothetical protein [Verrucomicrobiota bacterium]
MKHILSTTCLAAAGLTLTLASNLHALPGNSFSKSRGGETATVSRSSSGSPGGIERQGGKSSPTPRPSISPRPSPTPRPTISPAPSPTPRPSISPRPSPTPRPSVSPRPSPTPHE